MAKKKATGKKTAAARTGGADITLEKAVPKFLDALKEQGKNERTVEVYGRCLENAAQFFVADRPLGKLTPMLIGQYFKSDVMLKKPNGVVKSPITVEQTKRVLRLMLVWANEMGYIADVPLPKSEMKGKIAQKDIDTNATKGQTENGNTEAAGE
jgi:hypothetical protein